MKILVTGGAGFIGSHLVDRLLASGYQVLVVDNLATGREDNLSPHEELKLARGDIANFGWLESCFKNFRPEIVVHAAASFRNPLDWEEDVRTNILGSINVVNASKICGAKHIVYLQTSLCYGLNPKEIPVTLHAPLFSGGFCGGSSYAVSKTAAEQYIQLSGLPFTSFRLANIYGPRNFAGPVPSFYQSLKAGKRVYVRDTRRDFVYVGDLVDLIIKALENPVAGYFHAASGCDVAIKDLFSEMAAGMGVALRQEIEVRPMADDDTFTILLDPSLSEKTFNWRAKTTLSMGVAKAIAYYDQFGVTQTFTHLKPRLDSI